MAALAKSGNPSLCSPTPTREHTVAGGLANAAIAAGDACYIMSTGLIALSTGAAANAAAVVDGFAGGPAPAGESVTLFHDVHMHYGAGMTPGTPFYLSGTVPGGLDTVASVGGTVVIARALDATRVAVRRSW